MDLCALCGVNIEDTDLTECTCGKKYHKSTCAARAAGKAVGVIDACCSDKQATRGEGGSFKVSQEETESDFDSISELDTSQDSNYQSPNQHTQNVSFNLDITTITTSTSTVSSPAYSNTTAPITCLQSPIFSIKSMDDMTPRQSMGDHTTPTYVTMNASLLTCTNADTAINPPAISIHNFSSNSTNSSAPEQLVSTPMDKDISSIQGKLD